MQSLSNLESVFEYVKINKLITNRDIVDLDLTITDQSRRNKNFQVTTEANHNYLVKQAGYSKKDYLFTNKVEGEFYNLTEKNLKFKQLKKMVPKLFSYDLNNSILIIALIKNGKSLMENVYQNKEVVTDNVSALIGETMVSYHKTFDNFIKNKELQFLPKGFPLTLTIMRPIPELFRDLNQPNLGLIKIIQKDIQFFNDLNFLLKSWKPITLIHGDIRLSNIIITNPKKGESPQMKFVDWEMASLGDPAWDIGSVLQEFLNFWIQSIADDGHSIVADLPKKSKFQLADIQKSIRAFWYSYIKGLDADKKEKGELLLRSLKMCAFRLVQSAYESQHSSTNLSNAAITLLQISSNILKDPEKASIQLLGIPILN